MKFFKNKFSALTLIELITSLAISSVLFLIIFIFVTDSVEELTDNNVKIWSIDEAFDFKEEMGKFVRWWYSNAIVFTGITDPSYTWTTQDNQNNVLYLKKVNLSEWLLVWVVNLNSRKLQRNYVYGDNFLWYRYLTPTEMTEIDSNSWAIFDKEFFDDHIYKNIRIRDFKADIYNGGDLIEMYFNVINLFDVSHFDKDFEDFFIDKLFIDEYNLVY